MNCSSAKSYSVKIKKKEVTKTHHRHVLGGEQGRDGKDSDEPELPKASRILNIDASRPFLFAKRESVHNQGSLEGNETHIRGDFVHRISVQDETLLSQNHDLDSFLLFPPFIRKAST